MLLKKNGIGRLKESSLHAALKSWYAGSDDIQEEKVEGYWIDIVRGDLLIEIQTGNFGTIRKKLERLLKEHPVRLVYPIASEKYILRIANDDETVISKRKSPKKGSLIDLFSELVHIPSLVQEPNFMFEVLFIQEEVVWQDNGQGSWKRKGWSVMDHHLVGVVGRYEFNTIQDYMNLLPVDLQTHFTVRDLARKLSKPIYIASKMAYSLRKMGGLDVIGKRGRSYLYKVNGNILDSNIHE